MSREEIINIIETVLKSGDKSPGLFDLPKAISLKSRLESCASVSDVLAIIDEHRSFISKAFGVSEAAIHAAMEQLRALDNR